MENYFTIPKSAPVKDAIRFFWQVNRRSAFLEETIIPKGIVEIIFNFENTELHAQINAHALSVPKCFVQGFHTCPVQLRINDKQTFFGVVLHPAAARYIFRFVPAEFANCVIDLTLLDASFNSLWHHLAEQKTFDERVNIFTDWIKDRMPVLTNREKAINNFLSEHKNTSLSVTEAAELFCYSSRQLSRKLSELTGLNTEQTLLYKKYLHAIHLMHHSQLSLTRIAYSCHFSDQAHFIKTFKSLTLLTPREYRHKKSDIVGHVLENVR
jgi:AraC-like DNA-binding protein